MIAFKPSYLGHILSTSLLIASVVFQSVAMAGFSVAALAVALAYDFIERHYSSRNMSFTLPEEHKRKMQDLEARVTTIEYGIKARGF